MNIKLSPKHLYPTNYSDLSLKLSELAFAFSVYTKQCFQYCILYVPALSYPLSYALNIPTPSS